MQGFDALGKWLVVAGVILAVIGGIIWIVSRIPGLRQLPGTIHLNLGGVTVIFPLLASIVLSLVLTLILNIIARILRH
jgi:hypothetical protein